MKHIPTLAAICLSLLVLVTVVSGTSVLMQSVDPGRSGWNSKETNLTAKTIPQLQLLGTIPTVAPCSTQLLYYEKLDLQGHDNVLFCWTNPDRNGGNITVYAFDADTFQQIWALYIGLAGWWTTQAPAIDSDAKHIYSVYKNDNDSGYNYLIGIDIMTGKMLPGSPLLINATVPGTGDASVGGQLAFQNTLDATTGHRLKEDSRTSILIVNGMIYFGFAHNSDSFPYHGWVFGYRYDTDKFVQVLAFCVTPNEGAGGVWQGGQGLSSDGKSFYFATGNGNYNPAKESMSMAVIKMSLQQPTVEDYFVPANWKPYSNGDQDLGGCGTALIPNTHYLVVGVTKYGAVHLIDTTNMGKFTANNDACRQTVSLHSGLVGPGGNPVSMATGNGAKVFLWGPGLPIVQLNFNSATNMLEAPGVKWAGDGAGGGLFITSNGNNDPILWALSHTGTIYAFDASKDISAGPIWKATVHNPTSWGWPTVSNGKVYTNGGDSKVYVYGLK